MAEKVGEVFYSYAGTQAEIACQTYIKIFQDMHMVDSELSAQELTRIFQKNKNRGLKMDLEAFLFSLKDVAKRKDIDVDQIITVLGLSKGPKARGTTPQKVRLHDDRSGYTGVYKQGGLTTVDAGRTKIDDLSQITNREKADVRGVQRKYVN